MVICKSVVEWHDFSATPEKGEPVLILYKEDGVLRVSPCHRDNDGTFFDPVGWQESVYTDVIAWAYYPIAHILGVDSSGECHVYTSEAFF